MEENVSAKALLQLRKGAAHSAGPGRIRLLEAIGASGSITAAAKAEGLSYKGAWDAVQALNNLFDKPLVAAQPGGRGGGEAKVTPAGEAVLKAYRLIEAEAARLVERLDAAVAGADASLDQLIWSFGMRTSARNALRGVVTAIEPGAINCEVRLKIADDAQIVAIITRDSVEALGLTVGREALALIKSSFVILAPGEETMRTSARNCLRGVVIRHERGAVNDEVVADIGQGKTITAVITRQSADDLAIAPGRAVQALIKASHVILAVD
jgi:molybdate transport system regulatory protein